MDCCKSGQACLLARTTGLSKELIHFCLAQCKQNFISSYKIVHFSYPYKIYMGTYIDENDHNLERKFGYKYRA